MSPGPRLWTHWQWPRSVHGPTSLVAWICLLKASWQVEERVMHVHSWLWCQKGGFPREDSQAGPGSSWG